MTVVGSKFKDTEPKKGKGADTVVLSDPATKSGPEFGIRSHLHEFYDWRGGSVVANEAGGETWYLLGGGSSMVTRRRLVYTFRILTILGLLLLVMGAVLILIGYMWPKDPLPILLEQTSTVETSDGETYYYVRGDLAGLLEEKMRTWKLTGLVVFACGGTVLAISLLVPTCARLFGRDAFTSAVNTPVEPPVKIYGPGALSGCPMITEKTVSSSPPASPTERKVPAVEELAPVQPKSNTIGQRRASGDELLLMEEDEGKGH